MNKKLKKKWLKALRCGKYKQATGRLRGLAKDAAFGSGIEGHCCLGVLLDIADPEGWGGDVGNIRIPHRKGSCSGGIGRGGYINPSYARKLGIPAGVQKTLAKYNDRGDSFKNIADAIEKLVPEEEA